MAETFSIDPGQAQAAPQAQAAVAVGIRGAAQPLGGIQNAAGVDDRVNAATTDALFKLGSDILKPKIKQAAQEQFMEGVQRASTGEAITEIVADQPGYTQIFGPSSAVQGARAYTVGASIAQFGADMESQMPKLAQQGPEALKAALDAKMKELHTGDAASDAAITSQFVDQMAPLYKRHAKEHYVYNQNKASDQQVDYWTKLGKQYQGMAADAASGGTTLPENVRIQADNLIGSMSPFADQTDDSYEKNVTSFLGASAAAGNFQVVKLFKEKGLFDQLPPDARARLDGHFKTAGAQALAQQMPKYAVDVSMLVNDMTQNPNGVAARVAALNDKAAAASGVSTEYAQLIPNSSIDNIVGRVMNAQAHSAATNATAALTAAQKQAEAAQELAIADAQLGVPGKVTDCKAMGLCKEAAIETAASARYLQAPTPEAKAALLNSQPTEIFSSVKSSLVVPFGGKEDSPGFQALGKTYAAMTDTVKGTYFNADQRDILDKYNRSIAAGEAPAAAFQQAMVVTPMAKFYLDPSEKNAQQTAIRDYAENTNENMFGRNRVTDNALRTIAMVTNQAVVKGRGNATIESSTHRAYSEALGSGRLQIIGKHAAIGTAQGQRPLDVILATAPTNRVGREATNEAFDGLLTERMEGVGGNLDEATIVRLPDMNGQARYQVMSEKTDGSHSPVSFYLTSADVQARATAPKPPTFRQADDGRDADVAALRARQNDLNPRRP